MPCCVFLRSSSVPLDRNGRLADYEESGEMYHEITKITSLWTLAN